MLSLTQISKALSDAKETLASAPTLNVFIIANITLDGVIPYLRYAALGMGFRAEIQTADHDRIVQTALSNGVPDGTDVVVVAMHGPSAAPALWLDYAGQTAIELEKATAFLQQQIETTVSGLRNQTQAAILWHAFDLPERPALGILDDQHHDGQSARIHALNAFALEHLRAAGTAYRVDVNAGVRRLGIEAAYDLRMWQIARAPYARPMLAWLAETYASFVRALRGKSRKCLVLDCDNTIWGGVVGEDGVDGIKIGTTYPGACYRDLQRAALDLSKRGVILALCSKNNADDVWAAFDGRDEMLLTRDDIAAAAINWDDKPTNLMRLAEQLNIGLDSFVFVDDSVLETSLVRGALPQVEVIDLSALKPTQYARALRHCAAFDTLSISAEDRKRGQKYKAEVARKDFKAGSAGDLSGYLQALEMQVEVREAGPNDLSRVAQLIQRTNQFNLTTVRRSEDEVAGLMASPQHAVYCARLEDRFGDVGTIGVAIVVHEGSTATLDTLLMSCRALGRGVEGAFVDVVLDRCASRGASRIKAAYRPSAKNQQTASFFERFGFQITDSAADMTRYEVDIADRKRQIFHGRLT